MGYTWAIANAKNSIWKGENMKCKKCNEDKKNLKLTKKGLICKECITKKILSGDVGKGKPGRKGRKGKLSNNFWVYFDAINHKALAENMAKYKTVFKVTNPQLIKRAMVDFFKKHKSHKEALVRQKGPNTPGYLESRKSLKKKGAASK